MSPLLPPFLQPISADANGLLPSENNFYSHAVFHHSEPLGSAHAIWWPSSKPTEESTVILFIPGNPGLCSFYINFLSEIRTNASNLAILAHAHLGHTPATIDQDVFGNPQGIMIESQVKSAIEAFDAINYSLRPRHIVLICHSMGGWIALQILKARSDRVSGAFMLFPTLCDLAKSTNGQNMSVSRFFHRPLPRVISSISPLLRLVPFSVLGSIFSEWPIPQIRVLRSLLYSPAAIYASLTMAHDEMITICDLDVDLIKEHKHRIWIYFAERDEWVSESREKLVKTLNYDAGSLRIVQGEAGIPHAFCINHSQQVAKQCLLWMSSEGLL